MKVLLLDSYFGESHKTWAEGLKKFSKNHFEILSLKPIHWKWRMQGGSISLAEKFNQSNFIPDVVLATSMVNLALFKSLANINWLNTPCVLYFHENQLAYPFSKNDTDIIQNRDNHYGFIQYTSALIADEVWFNSNYNKDSFFQNLELLLKLMPKPNTFSKVQYLIEKSRVLSLGFEFPEVELQKKKKKVKTILWNHRWEDEKNPKEFLEALEVIKQKGIEFKLIISGVKPEVANSDLLKFKNQIQYLGFVKSKEAYWQLLQESDIALVTSNQDFFGISVVEAIYAGCFPLLPKRLSYPELFPNENFFYDDFTELVNKLEIALESIELPNFRKLVSHLNWKQMIEHYDFALANLPNNN